MPGQRKSIEPIAERLGVDPQSLPQFVSGQSVERSSRVEGRRQEIIPHLEPIESWVVDETGGLKQGQHSVGVSHQYCGSVGKQTNCQVSVEVVVSDGRSAAPIGGRLYLPESWTKDRARCARAGVPEAIEFATKPMIALQLVREALADGVAHAPGLGDAAYGDNAEFRADLRDSGLEFFLQVDAAKHKGRNFEAPTEVKWVRRHPSADTAEPYHYHLAHLHRSPTKARMLTLSRSRWHSEQYFQRAKDDLGLDHFEGRSWTGFHHHLVLSAHAYLFILTVHARAKKLLV